ncbi:MAG: cyclic nucleotide-binding domain-containing protein [Ilumatobacteraceae bacterium]
MKNARLHRFVLAHLLTVVGEWAAIIGVLVHAYNWGGSTAVGFVALAAHAPTLVAAPLAANLTGRYSAQRVRLAGFALQTIAFAAAGVVAAAGLPAPAVATLVVLGLGAINTLRPSGAVLLPAIAHSTEELVVGNLRVSHCDSVSGLVGPLVAAGLAGLGGSTVVFAACAGASAVAFLATIWKPSPLALARPAGQASAPRRAIRAASVELRERKWALGVLGVSAARNLVIGAFDVLLTIVALQALDLGDRGPGLMSALVGAGAAISVILITLVVRRARLRLALTVGLVTAAALLIVFGSFMSVPVAFVVLPVLGMCLSSMENLSRMLLQRSTDPRSLGPLFACLGLVGGIAQVAGVGIAQALLALSSVRGALIGIGVVLVLVALATTRALRDADSHADVPVVEMALLSSLPLFAPLPAATLEMVARSAERQKVAEGDVVIRQGESGDTFYAVAGGDFAIDMNGVYLRTAPRGDFFGEVALLSNVTRTATVTATTDGELLAIHRDPFLLAITGHEGSHAAATAYVVGLDLEEKMRRTSAARDSAANDS